jgi:hypothetical protein
MNHCRFFALGCLFIALTSAAEGQLSGAIGVAVGEMTTQFGGSNAYLYPKRTSPMIGVAPVITVGGHNDRNSGFTSSVGGDFEFPTDRSDATGNPTEYAGNFSVDWRYKFMGLGAGIEGRDFVLPSDPLYSRPAQFLVGVPFHYKVTFGPHNAAYVQAGASIWFYSHSQNANSTNQAPIRISDFAGTNHDIRVTGGYLFGSKHTALKVIYVHRDVYFDTLPSVAGSARPASPNPKILLGVNGDYSGMDFKQDEIGGGLVLVF